MADNIGDIELGAAAEATVHAYKELATDPAKRLPLALDQTCIQFLAYVVAEGAGTLVQGAIDTLQLLASSHECRPSLANTFGVLEALQEMADDSRYSEELRDQAISLFTCLQYSKHIGTNGDNDSNLKDGSNKNPQLSSNSSLPSQDSIDSVSSASEKGVLTLVGKNENKSRKDKSFLGPYNSKAKTVTLYISGMSTQDHRKKIEAELVRVKGLISIVFDLSKSQVTCRVKRDLSIDKLAAAVSRTDSHKAQRVIAGPNGEELTIGIGVTKPGAAPPVEDLPDYLPEDETPVKDPATAMAHSSSFKDTASSFISAAANLIQNSFYW